MATLRLMTQNQWNYTPNAPAWEEKGLDCSAETRMRGHVRVFKELLPDIVGGQEVNKDMQQRLPARARFFGASGRPGVYRYTGFPSAKAVSTDSSEKWRSCPNVSEPMTTASYCPCGTY